MNTMRDAAVVAVAGVAGVYFFGRPVLRAWRARSWPKVQGHVTKAHIDEVTAGMPGSRKMRYILRVGYTYPVNGATRSGNRLGFFAGQGLFQMNTSALDEKKKYPVGGAVDVRYDPDDPAEAVLITAVPLPWGAAFVLAVLFLLTGVWGIVRLLL